MVSTGIPRIAGVKRPLYSKPGAHAALERGAIEVLEHGAGDQHALPGAERERQVAGERTQQLAEQAHGFDAIGVAAVGGARGDFRRRQLRHVQALDFAKRQVDVGKAGAAQHALGGHAAVFLAQPAQQLDGAFVGGSETGMAALGGEHAEAPALAMTPPTPRPVPTPTMAQTPWVMGSDSRCEPMGLRSSARSAPTAWPTASKSLMTCRCLNCCDSLKRARGKRPGAVGELHLIAIDASGDRHRRAAQRRRHAGRVAAVMLRCVSDGFVGANGVAPHAMNVERPWLACRRPRCRSGCAYRRRLLPVPAPRSGRIVRDRESAPGSAVLTVTISLRKDCEDCARADNAVNRLARGFYLLINVTVVRDLQTLTPFDNAV